MASLPGYQWDARSGRYRNAQTGKYVKRQVLIDLVDANTDEVSNRLIKLTTAVHEGRLAPSVWLEQVKTEVKRLHIQNRALGAGGIDRLTPNDYSSIGGTLSSEYRHLGDFAAELPKLSLPQALSRVNMYVGSARKQFWKAEGSTLQQDPESVIIERRTLGKADHCPDCVAYYDQGWQLQGVLPDPGEGSVCGSNCRCTKQRKQVTQSGVDKWIGTKRA